MATIRRLKIFCCPYCTFSKRFDSIRALNQHVTKRHQGKKKINVMVRHQAQFIYN